MKIHDIKNQVQAEIDRRSSELREIAIDIHDNPELGWEEVRTSSTLASYLENNGFKVERGVADIKTAFKATYGNGKPIVCFQAELDALPGIGHACGHNLISVASVGAGIGVKAAVDKLGGQIWVMGTPAEELLGGKVIMVEKGLYNDVDTAMMIHPTTVHNWAGLKSLAAIELDIRFTGTSSHAAARPWEGVSALEALILGFSAVNSLRLHIKDRARIHGIILEGGTAANIIVEQASAKFSVRADDDQYLDELKAKVIKCFEGAALATGAKLDYKWGMQCSVLNTNMALLELWTDNMSSLGRVVEPIADLSGSVDMGNVSSVAPSIHPYVAMCADKAGSFKPPPAHSQGFAVITRSDEGLDAMIDGAKALAMTAVDVLGRPEAVKEIWAEFTKSVHPK